MTLEDIYMNPTLYGFTNVDYECKCNSIIIEIIYGAASLKNFLYENNSYFEEGIAIVKTIDNKFWGSLDLELRR